MEQTENLGLNLISNSAEDKQMKFSAWRAKIAGTGDDSNMKIIDAAVGELQESVDGVMQDVESAMNDKADKTDTVLNTTLSMGRKAGTTVGEKSVALGKDVEASAQESNAEGLWSRATGAYSHAEGYKTLASGLGSHAEGSSWDNGDFIDYNDTHYTCGAIGQCSHAEGDSVSAYAANTHAEGQDTLAGSTNAHAEGKNTKAVGYASHAEGLNTSALSEQSHAEGESTKASGYNSHAEGYRTSAIGSPSHAEGYYTTASGSESHAEGGYTTASGDYAHAEGECTIASRKTQHVFGKYNTKESGNSTTEGLYVEIVGNGTDQSRSNARTLDWSGNEWIAGSLKLGDSNTSQTVSGHGIAIGDGSTATHNSGALAVGGGSRATGSGAIATGGGSLASGDYSSAMGGGVTASGGYAHAEGSGGTTASGASAHAEGASTTASSVNAHAEGGGTTASGAQAHAEGGGTTASGQQAHAEGGSTTASGAQAHAEGGGTIASGTDSHSEGGYTRAAGNYSHAEGEGNGDSTKTYNNVTYKFGANGVGDHSEGVTTIAQGSSDGKMSGGAHAEGIETMAINQAAHAEGDGTIAAGEYSHAGGYYSKATGVASHAEGRSTESYGEASHAEGCYTTANQTAAHAEGYGPKATGRYSHAEGYYSEASNDDSHAEGYYTKASGTSAHAEGKNTIASGNNSHAEGEINSSGVTIGGTEYTTGASGTSSHTEGLNTCAVKYYSHAEGQNTVANGSHAHAEGYFTLAGADYSHAEGNSALALGQCSHAEGRETIANHKSQHVFGEYNVADSSTATAKNRGTYVEIVGNGLPTNRSNARTLDWNGNETLAGDLKIKAGTSDEISVLQLAKAVKAFHGGISDWAILKSHVKDGTIEEYAPVGTQIVDTWERTAGGTTYEAPWDVVHHGADGTYLEQHYTTPDGVPFDEPEAIYYAAAGGLPAGTYHIDIGVNYGSGWVAGQAIQFTLANAMAEGDQLVVDCGTNNANNPTNGRTWKVYAKGSTVSKENGKTSNGTGGTSLGTIGSTNAHTPSGQLNAISRVVCGYNRWSQSAMRQYLNSTEDVGNWWTPQNDWDRPPAVAATLRGWLAGCTEDFLNNLEPVDVVTALNNFDSSGSVTTETTTDRIFLKSLQETYVTSQLADVEGEDWNYYKTLAQEAGLSDKFAQDSTYPILISYRLDNHSSPVTMRLRSCDRVDANYVWRITSVGGVNNSYACLALMGRPACKISKS